MKIKNSEVENGCTTELDITVKGSVVAKMRLYWTVRSGMYGHQVGACFWDWREGTDNETYTEFKTGGCGYCKESNAFGHFISLITDGKHHGGGGSVNWYFGGKKYHKGGNYYSVPLSVLKKTFKRG